MVAQRMEVPAATRTAALVADELREGSAAPSPGLCRLFNAAAMDSGFCAWLLAAPVQAAASVARNAGSALGCSHGDPVLTFPPLPLTADDLVLVRRARGARSLGEAWRRITAASVRSQPPVPSEDLRPQAASVHRQWTGVSDLIGSRGSRLAPAGAAEA